MNTNKGKTIGRVVLFHNNNTDGINQPDLRGVVETPKGKYTISLWGEPNEKVTKVVIYKGQIKDMGQE